MRLIASRPKAKARTVVPLVAAVAGVVLIAGFVIPQGNGAASKLQVTKEDVEEMMDALSNWGRWGSADELGTLNLITPQKRKQAAALVREGISVSLARDIADVESTSFSHKMIATGQKDRVTSAALDEYRLSYHGYTMTHLDALCHVFYKGKMYNDFSQSEVTEKGAAKLSIVNLKNGVFTKAVLMDMPRFWGVEFLDGAKAIYPSDLDAWEKKAGVKVESGDVVLIRVGRWAREEREGTFDFGESSPGLHASCLPWLKERDVAMIGSDLVTDVLPSGIEGFSMPVHWVVLVAMGTPMLDNLDLEALSEAANTHKRWSFALTIAPLTVDGGTGSPVNPIATF
jgi:kynurenine formamidase